MDELGVLVPRRADARPQASRAPFSGGTNSHEDKAPTAPAAGPATTPSKRKRGSGPRLNDLQRLEIIRKRQASTPPVSLRQLAREYGVNEKTVRRVVAASAAIEERTAASMALGRRHCAFRRATPKFPELERALVAWIDARERARAEISPSVVIEKAKCVARALSIPPAQFKASWGWYDKFCRRYGVRTAFLGNAGVPGAVETDARSENDAVGASDSKIPSRETASRAELLSIMGNYDPELVFTMDETPLFYDQLPFPTVLNANTNESTSVGAVEETGGLRASRLHKRVTLVVCCNSTGRASTPVCLVGKEAWPSRLWQPVSSTSTSTTAGRQRFPLPYLEQPRAWLDRASFGRWFNSIFLPFVRQKSSNPVLLLVDGTRSGHQGDFEQDEVRVVFLPPPVTALTPTTTRTWWRKPLDMGVLAALKAQYKLLLLKSVLNFHDAPDDVKYALVSAEQRGGVEIMSSGVHFGRPATLLDTARLLARAWCQIPTDLLENCFSRANLVPPSKLLAPPARASDTYPSVYDGVAGEMEQLIADSSVVTQVLAECECGHSKTSIAERVKTFLRLDDESSSEFQTQLRIEIDAVLHEDVAAAVVDPATAAEVAVSTSQDAEPQSSASDARVKRQRLVTETRTLLLGATDVATKLRLLVETGANNDVPVPEQIENCIAAADEIRCCLQTFDASLNVPAAVSTTPLYPQEPQQPPTRSDTATEVEAAKQTAPTAFVVI